MSYGDGTPLYHFKSNVRVPAGATAGGVVAERALIEERQGAATIGNAFAEIEANPGDYPNVRAFYPATPDEAWEIAAKDAIRKAFKSVVVVRQRTVPGESEPRQVEIRWLHAPPGESGEREYQPLNVIREDQKRLASLLRDLETDAAAYYRKFQNVLAEISEAIGGS